MIQLHSLVGGTLDSISALYDHDHFTQALILVYSAIDTFAWLSTDKDVVTRTTFISWADSYILPSSGLPCTSADLYSARCGLLHTHSPQSAKTLAGQARQIWYWTGPQSRDSIQLLHGGRTDVVCLGVAELIKAFVDAAHAFSDDLARDEVLLAIAQRKASQWITWVPPQPAV